MNVLTALLSVAEVVIQFIPDFFDIPRGTFAGLAVGTSLANNIVQLIPQKNLEKTDAEE